MEHKPDFEAIHKKVMQLDLIQRKQDEKKSQFIPKFEDIHKQTIKLDLIQRKQENK